MHPHPPHLLLMKFNVNSSPAGEFRRLLITFKRPKSGPTERDVGLDLDPSCFETQMLFIKAYFEKVMLKKYLQTSKIKKKFSACKELKQAVTFHQSPR